SPVVLQAPSMTESPVSASAIRRLRRRSAIVLVIALSPLAPFPVPVPKPSVSVDDEAEIAAGAFDRIDAARDAIEPVHAAEQRRLRVRGRRKAVVGPRQFLLGD